MILGDMNICALHPVSSLSRNYSSVCNLFGLKQLISEPTRVTDKSSTLLDHILCNNQEKVCQSGVISVGISDHYMTYVSRKVVKGQIGGHKTVKIRSLKNYSSEKFVECLNSVDWSEVTDCDDVNMAWSNFESIFIKILDSVAPIKQVRLKQRAEPWFTSEILDLILERDSLLRHFKKSKSSDDYKCYCKLRNKVQRTVKKAKSDYLSSQIEENKNNPKKLWQHLKGLGYNSKSKENCNMVLNIDGEMCYDNKKVADHINEFYTTVASTLVNKLPPAPNLFHVASEKFQCYYRNKGVTANSVSLKPVSSDFICKELKKLNASKSTGLDGIPARFLKDGHEVLCHPIGYIVNLSITSGIVPNAFKCARVKPLFKKNSRLEVGNYRPVSILIVASKILERAVYTQLEDYLSTNNLLYDLQSGFRGNYSTDSCLIHLQDHIRSQTSIGNYTGMVLLDLQKAFDTVDHAILCQKLKTMGIESVGWFHSYLTSRKQIVCVNGVVSEYRNVSCGVPQGSLLGPLLFLCYVNDMEISVNCKLLLYGDDNALLVSHKDPEDILETLGK